MSQLLLFYYSLDVTLSALNAMEADIDIEGFVGQPTVKKLKLDIDSGGNAHTWQNFKFSNKIHTNHTVAYLGFQKEGAKCSKATSHHTKGANQVF